MFIAPTNSLDWMISNGFLISNFSIQQGIAVGFVSFIRSETHCIPIIETEVTVKTAFRFEIKT